MVPTSRWCVLLLSLLGAGAVSAAPDATCPRCNPAACPTDAAACPYGLAVPDPCACCPRGVCGLSEGEKCFDKALALPPSALRYGACGDGLRCVLRTDRKPWDEPEATCVCKETKPVCGSDNRTYATACALRKEGARLAAAGPSFQHMGPCIAAPWVVSGPTDQRSSMHASLALDCEAKGFPTPSITWEFQSADGAYKVLPSDDQYVAVQVRGGPEPFMATSWVQIVDLRPSDAGVYTCVASNSEGAARASATVSTR